MATHGQTTLETTFISKLGREVATVIFRRFGTVIFRLPSEKEGRCPIANASLGKLCAMWN